MLRIHHLLGVLLVTSLLMTPITLLIAVGSALLPAHAEVTIVHIDAGVVIRYVLRMRHIRRVLVVHSSRLLRLLLLVEVFWILVASALVLR